MYNPFASWYWAALTAALIAVSGGYASSGSTSSGTTPPVTTTTTASAPSTSASTPAPTQTTQSATATSTPPATSTTAVSPTPTPTPTTTTATTPAAGDPGCGGATVRKADGSAWTCTFDDEFNGTSLDRNAWNVQTTDGSGFTAGPACFVDSANNIAESGGSLNLTVRKEAAPLTCKSPTGNFSTQYTSGSVNGFNKFSQANGRFEVRAKLPSTTIKGLQETLWLWPDNPTKYGAWPASGEIDLGEFYSQYAGWNIPYLHYDVAQPTVNWNTNTNVYTALPAPNAQPNSHCQISVGAFNTYTVLWLPGQITLQVNGQNCIVDNYTATNGKSPAPFDQPFFMALTQGLGVGTNAVTAQTPLPATTSVDYVRIWK
jgi:beta-glucanase (GH16 family)